MHAWHATVQHAQGQGGSESTNGLLFKNSHTLEHSKRATHPNLEEIWKDTLPALIKITSHKNSNLNCFGVVSQNNKKINSSLHILGSGLQITHITLIILQPSHYTLYTSTLTLNPPPINHSHSPLTLYTSPYIHRPLPVTFHPSPVSSKFSTFTLHPLLVTHRG